MNKRWLLGLFTVLYFTAWTQKPMWKHFGFENGLYEPTINAFAQDRHGILWLGCQTGLVRFDGRSFVKVKPAGNEQPYINSLAAGKDGRIWAGTRDGIWKFNPENGVFKKVFHPNGLIHITNICWNEDSTQLLMIGGRAAWVMDVHEKITRIDHISADIMFYDIERCGKGFIASKSRELIWFDLKGKKKVLFNSQKFMNFSVDPSQKIVAAISEDGLFNIDVATLRVTKVNFNVPWKQVTVDTYHSVAVDEDHSVWVNTFDTLYQFSSFQDRDPVKHFWNKENPHSMGKTFCIFRDRDGNTWSNSEAKGISVLPAKMHSTRFTTFEELDSRYIWATLYYQRKLYYGADREIKILDLDRKSWETVPPPDIKTRFTITNIQDYDPEHLAVSTYGSGAWLLHKKTHRYSRLDLFPDKVNGISSVDGKHALALSAGGLYYSERPGAPFKLYRNTIYTFFSTSRISNGDRYVSNNTDLFLVSDNASIFKHVISYATCKQLNSTVLSICALDNGNVFLGTINNGLLIYESAKGKIRKVQLDPDPASVYGMSMINSRELLMTTNNGVYLYDLGTGHAKCYNVNNLLPFNDFNQFGYFASSEMISLTGTGGIFSAPPQVVRDLFFDHASIIVQHQFQIIDRLTVPAGVQSFAINAGIGLKQAEHNPSFKYRLKGLDLTWHEMDPSGNIAYNYVPPGNYLLEINMQDPNHILADQTKRIPVEIVPLWWQTFWFRALIWIVSLLVMIMLIRYFSRLRLNWKIRRMEAEQKVNKERMRISRELHDNVGSQLSYLITGLEASEMMLQKDNTENLTRNLENLQESARESMQQLRDAIWALNKEEISASVLIGRFTQWVDRMTEQHQVSISITSSVDEEVELDSLKTLNIFRILQEAVHNILKHAQASKAAIHFSLQNGVMLVSVQDNGCGFESLSSEGNGLRNMQARAKELGAVLEIDSQKGIGTALALKLEL